MSSTSRIESCGEMKSQKLGAQGERDERVCIDFGFKAQNVMEAAESLDEADRHEVEQLGYSPFLNLKLGQISQRKETYLCMKLVDLEEDRIKVQLQNDVIVYIRPDEIHHLLMLPQGPKAPLKYNMQQHKDFMQLRSELGQTSLDSGDILKFMKKEENKHLRVKCFFLILFSRFLMPTTSQNINVHAVMYTRDLASLKEFDMCTIVYEHLRDSIKIWKKQRQGAKNKASLTMPGCPIIILGFIVDNLKLTDSVNKNRPRLNEYDMATLMDTICKAKDNGRISFENFKLKSLEEICYAQSSRFCIQSAVDSQDVRSAMATSAVVTSGVPEVIQSAVQILSSVQNPESFGVDQAQVDACIARLSALQPVGASCSNVGASCSISEAAEATSTKKADEEEAAEATSTKKADEEEIIALQPVGASCSNVGDSCSISEAAEAANTKKAAEEEIIALQPVGARISKAAKSKSRATKKPAAAAVPTRVSPRLNGAVEGGDGDVTSPIRKHLKTLKPPQ